MDVVVRKERLFIVIGILLAIFSLTSVFSADGGEKPGKDEMSTRGIGGTRPGYATGEVPEQKQNILHAIEEAYDESYSELIDSFLQSAAVAGKSTSNLPALRVEFDVVREVSDGGISRAIPVIDGDTLTGKDNYKIQFQCSGQCYIYIAQLDSTGKMDPIFPSRFASGKNPLAPDTLYSVPSDTYWFYLDENVGRETIYVIASRARRTDIEGIFNKLSKRSGTLVEQSPVTLASSYVLTRGIGGTRKGRDRNVSFQDGSQGRYTTTEFSTEGADFVMTRWFYHR